MHNRYWFVALVLSVALCGVPRASDAQSSEQRERPSAAPAEEARVRPGDQVVLRIFREPEMSGTYSVSETGEAVLPRIGRIQVTEMDIVALQDSLLAAYAVYLRNPAIEVTILRRISVLGEVRRPDVYMIDLTMTLRDVLARAGGVTEAGNRNRISIVRDGEQIRLPDRDIANMLAAELRSGDQVVVDRRSWISINALGVISTAAVAVSVFVPLIRSLTS
jgi:protein involved in polysaccharide export with SLBB domain